MKYANIDKDILNYIISDSGKVMPQRANVNTMKNRGWYDYLIQRYKDNTTDSFAEIIYRLVHGIEEIPVCKNPNCNNNVEFKILNKHYPTYCCPHCRNTSPEVLEKNKIGVSKALKKVYSERKNEIQEKRAKALNSRYGGDSSTGSPFSYSHIREKAKLVNMERYGVDNVMYLSEYHKFAKKVAREKSVKLWKERGFDIEYNDDNIIIHNGCEIHGDVSLSLIDFNNRTKFERINTSVLCPICNKIKYSSGEEKILKKFFDDLGVKYIENDRNIIKPYELDFYLPDYKIAIEMNGVYYHSELFGKDKSYHIKKLELCEKIGIKLIYIWEDLWINKNKLILSMIKVKLGFIDNKIYARNCDFCEIDSSECKSFLNENHIQGEINSSYKYGLKYNGELISVMCFGKTRRFIGGEHGDDCLEMYRFCTKKDLIVVGGASKLLNHSCEILKNQYGINKIISYSERDWFSGCVYEENGFEFVGYTEPNYFWINGNGTKMTRYETMKHKLILNGEDSDLTESEIMNKKGFYKCWNSGNLKFEKIL